MSEEAKSGIAASRAIYFSELQEASPPACNPETAEEPAKKRPSYVGISNSLNGYTPYAPYRAGALDPGRKLSPPVGGATSAGVGGQEAPRPLDSVSLVANQDGFQKSLAEFQQTMRDLNMGRPQSEDITDNAKMMHVDDEYYPASHIKQVIENGDTKSVTTITQFHSHNKQNLVSKQIERLYGADPLAQVRISSAEAQHKDKLESSQGDGTNLHQDVASDLDHIERKLSGGFFSKRFGITKMKDHSTIKSPDIQKEYKPLKVPAVFKLLRPEFREQLKQSSCKVSMPEEGGKERIIPIRIENNSTPITSPSTNLNKPSNNTPPTRRLETTPPPKLGGDHHTIISSRSSIGSSNNSPASAEKVIPIARLNGVRPLSTPNTTATTPSRNTINGTPTAFTNGVTSSAAMSPTASATGRRPVPTVIGFRTSPTGSCSDVSATQDKENTISTTNSNNTSPVKQIVIRKLSPLSPKHIISAAASANGSGSVVKPAPAPKPEHLMSPPISPVPSSSDESSNKSSPVLSRVATSKVTTHSPAVSASPILPKSPPKSLANKPVAAAIISATTNNNDVEERDDKISLSAVKTERGVAAESTLSNGDGSHVNGVSGAKVDDSQEKRAPCEEPLEYGGEYEDEHQYQQYYGLRERELLCPILEEDNESTASGSVVNLPTNCPAGGVYSPDDPLLLTEQGEVQDGHYYLKVLENEIFKFEEQICDFEEELSISSDIPEDCRENIQSVVGMAKLLMAQKLTQFRGLCDKNLSAGKDDDPFVPTSQDLAGFWDMVHIQVVQVHGKFEGLQKLRSNGWKTKVEEVKPKSKKAANKSVNKPIKPKEKSQAAKARDEARKKMLDARKKAMKEAKQDSNLIIMM